MQNLGLVGMMTVEWPVSLQGLFSICQFLLLDIDSYGFSCIAGQSEPVRYLLSALIFPLGVAWLALCFGVSKLFPKKHQWEGPKVCWTMGAFLQVGFSTMSATSLAPMMCYQHPNGQRSIMKYPGVICGSSEHDVMLVIAWMLLMVFVFGFVSLCAFAAYMVPWPQGVLTNARRQTSSATLPKVPRWSAKRKDHFVACARFLVFRFRLVTTALLTSAAAWGQSLNAWDLDEAAKAHLANWRLAVFGPRPPSSERASPYLKQFFILGHCSELRFVVITRFIMTLARWYHWRSPSQEVRQAVAEQMQHIVHQVNNGLAEWGWRPTSWGRWACTADHTFSIFSNKNERAKAKHQLRQSWRKTLLLRWLQTDRRDADIGRHINLQDQIDDSFVDQLRKIFKRCTDSHVQAVMMGGMRTAASTRWAGNFEEVTEAGDMVCLDCHQENHPTVDHILWQCPAFSSLRRLPAPTCPFVRRLGWGPSVTIEESVKLLAQMGKIREAEVISRMARVRLQNRIHQIRGGGDTYSWTTKVLYKAKVLAPEVLFLGCCDGAAGAAEDWQLVVAAPCAGANLTTRKGKVVRVHVCLMPKEIQKPCGGGLFVSCWFLIARDMNKMANKKAKKTKEEPRKLTSVVVQLFGARLGFVCSLVHVLHVFLVLEGPVLFLALLAGTRLFEKPCGGLFANCCFVLFFPVMKMAKQEGQKKKEEKNMWVWKSHSMSSSPCGRCFRSVNSFLRIRLTRNSFGISGSFIYLSFFALGHLLCAARHVQLLVPFAAGLDDFATCMWLATVSEATRVPARPCRAMASAGFICP